MARVLYELLVRNDHLTGEFKGAHVKLFDTETHRDSDAMSIAQAEAEGYSLTDILTAVELGAIKSADAAIAERDAAIAERDEARQQCYTLAAQIAELQKAQT